MYKLFLTLRYLTRKAIVIFPILVVWLCVAMMIIVASIMGGFVDHVKQANRDLLGDVIISTRSSYGFPYYAELQAELAKLKDKSGRPVVEVSTPLIKCYGLINFPEYHVNNFAQVVGVDPAGRVATTGFRETLYRQYALPVQASSILEATGLPATGKQLQDRAEKAYDAAMDSEQKAEVEELKGEAAHLTSNPMAKLKDTVESAKVAMYLAERVWTLTEALNQTTRYASREAIEHELLPAKVSFDVSPDALARNTRDPKNPPAGCIPGAGIGLYRRDRKGDFLRRPDLQDILCELTVVPLTKRGKVIEPQAGSFVIVDDTYSQVYDVDSTYVFAPFEKVQHLAFMDAGKDADDNPTPARCTELQLKTVNGNDEKQLVANRELVEEAVHKFMDDPARGDMYSLGVEVETWSEKQATYIAAVENEKNLITFILGLMSIVVVVVIFLIFYMIVRDKTRDIGIIKALGGSEAGVMSIFMLYGTFIGVVGGVIGAITGVAFVWNTNFIHDKIIYGIFGLMIWRRDVYMFDRIPDTVHPREVAGYLAAAIVAGFLGATLPAVLAAYQDPVKAVRYE